MVKILVFGPNPPCARCKRAEEEALKAAGLFPGQVEVSKMDAFGPEAEAYGVMATPTVVVGDNVVASGRIVPAKELADHIKAALEG